MPNDAKSNSYLWRRHAALRLVTSKPSRWVQNDTTNPTKGSVAGGRREQATSMLFASCGAHTAQQLLKFMAYGFFEHVRGCADKIWGGKACTKSNHIGGWLKSCFKFSRHGVNLTTNHVACHSALGPPFGGECAHSFHTIDKQGRGFSKPRPCRGFDRDWPLMQHKMRCACHGSCRHDSLKF